MTTLVNLESTSDSQHLFYMDPFHVEQTHGRNPWGKASWSSHATKGWEVMTQPTAPTTSEQTGVNTRVWIYYWCKIRVWINNTNNGWKIGVILVGPNISWWFMVQTFWLQVREKDLNLGQSLYGAEVMTPTLGMWMEYTVGLQSTQATWQLSATHREAPILYPSDFQWILVQGLAETWSGPMVHFPLHTFQSLLWHHLHIPPFPIWLGLCMGIQYMIGMDLTVELPGNVGFWYLS